MEGLSDDSEDTKRIKRAAESLSEHYDAVQIFATRHEPGTERGTLNWQYGLGNIFARTGHVRSWLIEQDEIDRRKPNDDP